jgi:hypothetical protein
MNYRELAERLGYSVLGEAPEAAEIQTGYTSDLLSDVMGNAPEGAILITIQGHKNTVAVAQLAGLPAILLCNGRSAPPDMREAAENEGVALLSSQENQFTASYRIAGLLGLIERG